MYFLTLVVIVLFYYSGVSVADQGGNWVENDLATEDVFH